MWAGAESIVLVIVVALSLWLWIVKTVPKTVVSKMKMKQERKKTYLWPKRHCQHLLGLYFVWPSSLLFHPQSTPWAVAREAGGGWCVIHCTVPIIATVIRPFSSCATPWTLSLLLLLFLMLSTSWSNLHLCQCHVTSTYLWISMTSHPYSYISVSLHNLWMFIWMWCIHGSP